MFGRNNLKIPSLIESSKPLSKKIELTTDSIIAMKKTINIKSKEKITLDYIVCVSNDREYVLNTIKKYMNSENNKRVFELSKARIEAENRYLELTGKDVETYQRLLTFIFENHSSKKTNLESKIYPITELWKFGISGDLPIIFAKIKNVSDIDVIDELVKAYEYFKTKNLEIDLVILNEEKENYDSYVKEGINNVILNRNIAYMLNIKGGIYVLNNIKNEDKKIIEAYSNLVIEAQNGSINLQLNDLEEASKFNIEEINENLAKQYENGTRIYENEKQENELQKMELQYFNQYGGFSKDGKEYLIKINKEEKTPMPWSHIMANENFGTLTTESIGGYCWYKNSRLNRLTAFSNNAIVDMPSEVIYIKDEETRKAWSLGLNPMPDNNDYYVVYGFGYAKYIHTSMRNKARAKCICSKRR